MSEKQNGLLQTRKTCVTIAASTDDATRKLFLGLRQALLMQIANDERTYNERRAAQYLQLGQFEEYLGVDRTKKR